MEWPWRTAARRRSELSRLRETEAYYRLLAEHSPDVTIRYDMDGRLEYISDAIRRYGADPARLIGRRLADLLDPGEAERNEQFMADLAEGRIPAQGRQNVWRTARGDGGWVYWEGSTRPIVENGRVIGAMAVLRDVSERVAMEADLEQRRAEAQAAMAKLADSEMAYRALADYAGDVIVRYNADGVIEFASPSIVRVLGYTPEAVIGRHMAEFSHPDDTGESLAERLERLRAGREPPSDAADNEFRARRADGSFVWLQGNPSNVLGPDGRPLAVITVLRDVTERRSLEAALRRQRAEAEAAVVAKAEFLATMSHEIRTPLTAVVGFASLLRGIDGLPDRARTYAERIGRGGDMLTAIVNNVLDFSKIEAGQMALKREAFDPAALITETLGLVADTAAAKDLRLDTVGLETLPGRVNTDSGQLRQVLLNLLANAVKFTRSGGVTVEASHDLALGRLSLAVRDTGIGIPAHQATRLFQRFTQAESSNARRFGGVGLGLAISKGLVELMGGEIGLESVEGEGSVFRFWVDAPASAAEAAPLAPTASAALPRLRILVVDDVRANRELIRALLGRFDVDLTEAGGGRGAVETAARADFDLILMDLQMPDMDGIAATRAIRAPGARNRGTPVVAVSASVLPSDVEACRAAGMCDHVAKPIDSQDLVAKIARWGAPPEHPSRRCA